MTAVLMLLAGGLGGLARYGLAGAVQRRAATARPWGTAAVNLSGAATLGLVAGLHSGGTVGDTVLRVVGVGFLGGFTTFSSWMVESVRLAEEAGRAGVVAGLVNLAGMTAAGVAAVAASRWVVG